jgi:hypothetical protein
LIGKVLSSLKKRATIQLQIKKEHFMLKRGSKGWAVWNIVEAIILAAIGVLCVVYNEQRRTCTNGF